MNNIRIGTYNVKGIADSAKRRKVFHYLHIKEYDIVFLQETHSVRSNEKYWRSVWGGRIFFSHGASNARGTAIMIRKKAPVKVTYQEADPGGRWVILHVEVAGIKMSIAGIYAPNEDNPLFFQEVFKKLVGTDRQIIIGGDFNLVLDMNKDKFGGLEKTNKKSSRLVKEYMKLEHLYDVWRELNCDKRVYTYQVNRPSIIRVRLDYILVSASLLQNVKVAEIVPGFMTDHSIPFIMLAMGPGGRGSGFWKLNTSLLKDDEYVVGLYDIIDKELDKEYTSETFRWEFIKSELRGYTIRYSSRKNKSRNNTMKALEAKKQRLTDRIMGEECEGNPFDKEQDQKELLKVETEIQEIVDYKTKGAMVRAKRNWMKFGEKSSKFFYSLEKYNFMNKNRYQLKNEKGDIVTDQKEILDIQKRFYERLYRTELVEIDKEYLEKLDCKKLLEEDRERCEEVITMPELKEAIFQLNKNKSPGCDGWPIELYQQLFTRYGTFFLKLFREISYYNLPDTSKIGIISLLEKPGKELLELPNWRPLSLLNSDGKIFAKMLANRMRSVQQKITHPDQMGFLKDRYIGENLLELLSVIDYCRIKEIPALVISLDMMKAFDRVEWIPFDKILEFFNFGPFFRSMVQVLHADIKSCTTNLGKVSDYFPIKKGLRQGCPFSPPGYLLIAEILGQKIRQNDRIKGIHVDEYNKKLAQYADDTWVVIKAEKDSYDALFEEIQQFEINTGLKVNYDKTQILRIGSLRHSNAKFYSNLPLIWSDHLNVLGIDIYPETEKTLKNYESVIKKMNKILDQWSLRGLTVIGKILVSNTLAVSQLVYRLFCLPTPTKVQFKSMKNTIREFLWNKGKALIAYDKLTYDIQWGGLRLVDIEAKNQAFKISWVHRSYNTIAGWKIFASQLLPMPVPDIWECNISASDILKLKIDSLVWRDIWIEWAKYYHYSPEIEYVGEEGLWFNTFVRNKNGPVYYDKMYRAGIRKIIDIYDHVNHKFLEFEEIIYEYGEIGNFLEYRALIAAIPTKWKESLRRNNNNCELLENKIDFLLEKPKITKIVYWEIMDKKQNSSTDGARIQWNRELGLDLDKDDWGNIRLKGYQCSDIIQYRYFQYRLLSKKLVTRVNRHKWDDSVKDDKCIFCKIQSETILHLLWECPQVQRFWKKCN